MKSRLRYLVFLALVLVMGFATSTSTSLARDPVQNGIDPSCTETCVFMLTQCASTGTKNDLHACYSIYKHCMAQCGKHD